MSVTDKKISIFDIMYTNMTNNDMLIFLSINTWNYLIYLYWIWRRGIKQNISVLAASKLEFYSVDKMENVDNYVQKFQFPNNLADEIDFYHSPSYRFSRCFFLSDGI